MSTERPIIPDVLADRYASSSMSALFSAEYKILLERDLWISVMKAQKDLGLNIPNEAIDAYEKVKNIIDLNWIRSREAEIRHDEKAKIEAFNMLAGHEYAHLGLTSRDISDNVEQVQIKGGLEIIRGKSVAYLNRLSNLARKYKDLVFTQRTHLMPAQPSLVGKIFSDVGEEFLLAYGRLEHLIENYPLRGIKGAVGTMSDQIQLFDGDYHSAILLDREIAKELGFNNIFESVGQIYPRSLDFDVVSTLFQLICAPSSFARTTRFMSALNEFSEGFVSGQVGSSAMPHKKNSRSSERINALKNILSGYVAMSASISGEQFYAGDVSDSAVRRVFIPDSFFAADAIFETTLQILDNCEFFPEIINSELNANLQFLTTTRLLMAAVKCGVGREMAHSVIKEHADFIANVSKTSDRVGIDLVERVLVDQRLNIPREKFTEALKQTEITGAAIKQINIFVQKVDSIVQKHPIDASYLPEGIL